MVNLLDYCAYDEEFGCKELKVLLGKRFGI
jgi:hypothetical protein